MSPVDLFRWDVKEAFNTAVIPLFHEDSVSFTYCFRRLFRRQCFFECTNLEDEVFLLQGFGIELRVTNIIVNIITSEAWSIYLQRKHSAKNAIVSPRNPY